MMTEIHIRVAYEMGMRGEELAEFAGLPADVATRVARGETISAASSGPPLPKRPLLASSPPPPRRPALPAPVGKRASGGALARFKAPKAHPERVHGLSADHPAVVEGRTLFPSTVVGTFDSPRFLVSGVNSPKTGKKVVKGPWADMPIYTLTLEERKTCPSSCGQWRSCYGNGMQFARRNDVGDPDFLPALGAEVVTLARQHPDGVVLRLHILGDFYSVKYVRVWRHLMEMLPMLHVFGYTARRHDAEDDDSPVIAEEIAKLNAEYPDRWVIRTSHSVAGPMRAVVRVKPPAEPDVILCPAMTEATAACSTCGLCWAPAARDKTIAFLLHGNF